ncbi:MAG: hypothetical protein IJD06_01315 [Clostridia bacterium]|nr:hypothetical protein [Clostridia bacterium]
MKEIRELKLEELNIEQKLGMSTIGFCADEKSCDVDYLEELIRNHALGAVWIVPRDGANDHVIKRLKEAADYPLLVFTDAESGFGENQVGRHNAIGCTGSAELAYIFGKVTALSARAKGYNVICNPVLDMVNRSWTCGGNVRGYGADKQEVVRLASAEARGMHDAGVLTVGKHYPGATKTGWKVDSHMGENSSDATVEELLEYNLFPYVEMAKEGLLDGVMLAHSRYTNIDPDYPTSLSKETIRLIRERGFDGFAMTDALNMMGVVAKFGRKGSVQLAAANSADLSLPFMSDNRQVIEWLREGYEEGIITEARLDEIVSRVLAAQHKVFTMEPKFDTVTPEDLAAFAHINTDSVFAKTDEGIPTALEPEGRHFFAILTEGEMDLKDAGKVQVDTMLTKWYNPVKIAEQLKELFPNSTVATIADYPTPNRISRFLSESLNHDGVVFITFFQSACYVGRECFTSRILSLMDAMQVSGRISTILHFGNPYLLEEVPHIPRVLVGTISSAGVDAALEVLAGKREAKGVLTYDVKIN